jgi:hypothetical protein
VYGKRLRYWIKSGAECQLFRAVFIEAKCELRVFAIFVERHRLPFVSQADGLGALAIEFGGKLMTRHNDSPRYRKTLFAGAMALAVSPLVAGGALAQAYKAEASSSAIGAGGAERLQESTPESVEDRGYSNVEPAANTHASGSELAFNAVDPKGNPVLLVVDRSTGRVIREKEMRTLPVPSKNQ